MAQPFAAVLLNHNDEGFVKVQLDTKSKDFFIKNIKNIENPLTRCLIWKSFWDSVRDGQISFKDFLQAGLNNIDHESHSTVLRIVLDWQSTGLEVYTPYQHRQGLRKQLFDLVLRLLTTKQWEKHTILLLKQKLLSFCYEEEDVQLMYDWFYGKQMQNIEIGLQNKWTIVKLVNQSSKMSAEQK